MPTYAASQAAPEEMPPKDPDAEVDYDFDWTDWLGTDTISTFTVTADTGITVSSSSHASGVITYFLTGGTHGQRYKVRCNIVTTGGRTEQRTALHPVAQR